jgi:hypothetical protein
MDQSRYWDATSSVDGQTILRHLYNSKDRHRVHKKLPLVAVSNQLNTIRIFTFSLRSNSVPPLEIRQRISCVLLPSGLTN